MAIHRADLKRAGLPATNRMTVHDVFSCPVCGTSLGATDAITDPDAEPKADDLTLCADCGAILIFTSPSTVRLATQEELDELLDEAKTAIAQAQQWITKAKGR